MEKLSIGQAIILSMGCSMLSKSRPTKTFLRSTKSLMLLQKQQGIPTFVIASLNEVVQPSPTLGEKHLAVRPLTNAP